MLADNDGKNLTAQQAEAEFHRWESAGALSGTEDLWSLIDGRLILLLSDRPGRKAEDVQTALRLNLSLPVPAPMGNPAGLSAGASAGLLHGQWPQPSERSGYPAAVHASLHGGGESGFRGGNAGPAGPGISPPRNRNPCCTRRNATMPAKRASPGPLPSCTSTRTPCSTGCTSSGAPSVWTTAANSSRSSLCG